MSAQSCEPQSFESRSDDIRALVRGSPVPVWLLRLEDRRIIEASDALASLLAGGRERFLQRDVTDFIVDPVQARSRLELLASGELDGYRVLRREYRRLDGTGLVVDGYVAAYPDDADGPLAIGVILPAEGSPLGRELPRATTDSDVVVLGTVDDGWRIDRVSADVQKLLGYQAREIIGRSLATLVHVDDLPSLLMALGQALQGSGGASTRLQFRTAAGGWQLRRALITPLAGPSTQGFGFAFALTDSVPRNVENRTGELENHLRRIAKEVAATGVLAGLLGSPAVTSLPSLAELSWRELQIVSGLLAAERVPMIARRLFVSESTVRNHLTSVYRKLGVSSQQELLVHLHSHKEAVTG
jgi:PAS domain S-box-containing protein